MYSTSSSLFFDTKIGYYVFSANSFFNLSFDVQPLFDVITPSAYLPTLLYLVCLHIFLLKLIAAVFRQIL